MSVQEQISHRLSAVISAFGFSNQKQYRKSKLGVKASHLP